MDDTSLRAGLVEHFGALDPSLLSEAVSTCKSHHLDAEDYYYRWEAFVIEHQGPESDEELAYTLDTARELRKLLTAQLAKAGSGAGRQEVGKKDGKMTKVAVAGGGPKGAAAKKGFGMTLDDELGFTPQASKIRPSSFGSVSQSRPSWAGGMATPKPRGAFNSALMAVKAEDASTPARSNGASSSNFSSPDEKKPFEHGTPAASSNTDAGFVSRQGAMTILESLNADLPATFASPSAGDRSRIQLKMDADPKAYNYRYMFEKLSERSAVLDTLIEDAAALLCGWYGEVPEGADETLNPFTEDTPFPSTADGFGDPTVTSQGPPIWAVGRLCPEPSATNTSTNDPNAKGISANARDGSSINKLSEKGCFLEGSRMGTGGRRAWLRFDPGLKVRGTGKGSGGVGLFPGALVAVKGRNGGGGYFNVTEVVTMPPVDPPVSYRKDLLHYQYAEEKLNGEPLRIVVAAGPYTTDDSFEFLPFQALIDELVSTAPDLIILLGPFLDSQHPLIRSGNVDHFPSQIIRTRFSPLLKRLLDTCRSTSAILLPSSRDLISSHLAFPQSPLSRDPELDLPKRAKLLPNPAVFTVNEVSIAATSVDTLMALRQAEWFRAAKEHEGEEGEVDPTAKEAIPRACRHVMRQRSFYPIFPPAAAPHLETINLDITHYDHLRYAPNGIGADVLILPSSLTPFVKVVDSTVVINPGQLGKSKKTFVQMAVHPMARKELEDGGAMQVDGDAGDAESVDHRVFERCRVDVVRV